MTILIECVFLCKYIYILLHSATGVVGNIFQQHSVLFFGYLSYQLDLQPFNSAFCCAVVVPSGLIFVGPYTANFWDFSVGVSSDIHGT